MKSRMNFKLRLAIWYSTILFGALLLFGLLSYYFVSSQLYDEQYALLLEDAEQISEVIRVEDGGLDIKYLGHETSELNLNENGVFFAVLGDMLQPLFLSPNFPAGLNIPAKKILKEQRLQISDKTGAIYTIISTRVNSGEGSSHLKEYYFLYTGQSVRYVERSLVRIRNLLLLLGPLVLFVSILSGWYMTRRFLQPVAAITHAAREISTQNLDRRLSQPKQNDELSQLATTFNGMIDRIQAGVSRIQQFTADASHELRTPLTVMRGEMEVALRRNRTAQEYKSVLESALQELDWMEKIVNELLLLSRAEAGQIELKKEACDLGILVQKVLSSQQTAAHNKGVELQFSLNENNYQCMADADKTRQMLLNIINNAIKYSNKGGTVQVCLQLTGQWLDIIVRDNGIGIPEKDLPHIFDRFYRVDKSRSREQHSSGLGLSISKWIAELHGGRIEIDSTLNRGTTVKISLPKD